MRTFKLFGTHPGLSANQFAGGNLTQCDLSMDCSRHVDAGKCDPADWNKCRSAEAVAGTTRE